MKSIKKFFESLPAKIIGFSSSVLGLVLNTLILFGITDNMIISIIGIIIFVFGIVVLFIVSLVQHSRITELNKENEVYKEKNTELSSTLKQVNSKYSGLLNLAYSGMEFSYNSVTIDFDKDKKMYHLQFEKHFTIITNIVPEYYSAQFYANKYITDKDKAKRFYKNNPISWEDLKVRACISYKRPKQKKFSDEKYLEIVNITDNSNYIPFKIMYRTYSKGEKINLIQNTQVRIKYCYSVPISHWGSYINRTISYFGEKAKVVLRYDSDADLEYSIVELKGGAPCVIDNSQYETIESYNNNKRNVTFSLKYNPSEGRRFRIKWDAEKYFEQEGLNTVDGIDQLGLTNK